jgi:hypothetical protein
MTMSKTFITLPVRGAGAPGFAPWGKVNTS